MVYGITKKGYSKLKSYFIDYLMEYKNYEDIDDVFLYQDTEIDDHYGKLFILMKISKHMSKTGVEIPAIKIEFSKEEFYRYIQINTEKYVFDITHMQLEELNTLLNNLEDLETKEEVLEILNHKVKSKKKLSNYIKIIKN